MEPSLQLGLVALAAAAAGAVNSIAGGGTLLTFPALIAAGVPPLQANATSTVALVPGVVGSMWGYRGQLAGARPWVLALGVPSVVGGAIGAGLLLWLPAERFEAVVPWLVGGATALFLAQAPLVRWVRGHGAEASDPERPRAVFWLYQLGVGVYGGYFGAGIGILMLAALGFMGLANIHRMNGLKNWGGFCMNFVAAAAFAASGLVEFRIAAVMAVASTLGGYAGSRVAQKVPQVWVRRAVVGVGLAATVWLAIR